MYRIYFQKRLSLNLRKLTLVVGVALFAICSGNAQTLTTVATGLNGPLGLALDGNDLYVAELGANRISHIDISAPLPAPVSTLLSGVNEVIGVAVVGDYLYFCSQVNIPGFTSSVGRVNLTASTPTIEIVATNLNGNHDTQALLQNGNDLYISAGNVTNNGIYKIDLNAGFPQVATQVIANVQTSGMALRNNEMFIGNFEGTEVKKFNLDNPDATLTTVVGGLNGPDGLCFNGNFLYISEFNGTTIQRIDVTDAAPVAETAVSDVSGASLVAFDGLDLYFSEYYGNKVSKVTLNEPVISVQPNICAGSSNNALGGASPTGGVYSGPGVTNNGDGETFTFNPTTAGGIGTYTITYTATNNSTVTTTIEVVAAPTVTFTLPADIAIGSGAQTLNGSPAGGTYSGNGITGNTFNPSEAGIGSHTITYTYQDANGCGGTVSATVSVVNSLDCPTGTLFLETQAQVDAFIINYPNCTVYDGNIIITGSNITNLNGLNNIVSILGYLDITYAHNLTNLAGLSNLTNIGGYLFIQHNDGMTSLNGLNAVTNIGGFLNVSINDVLADISALQNVNPNSFSLLQIYDNLELSVCNLPNFCIYLANPSSSHPRSISDNAGDCITEQAVIDACSAPAEGCLTIHSTYIQWPTATVTPACTNSPEVITAQGETGEYSKIQLTAQIGYYFSSSVATDYVTISNEDGTAVYAYGTGEVSLTSPVDQVVRFYLHLDDDCNGSTDYRSRIVQCQGTIGVAEMNKTNISYYPNPVNDILNVTSEEIISTIDVINMLGQTVVTKTANSATSQIEMAQFPSGNYLVKVTSANGVQTVRVMKQ